MLFNKIKEVYEDVFNSFLKITEGEKISKHEKNNVNLKDDIIVIKCNINDYFTCYIWIKIDPRLRYKKFVNGMTNVEN